MDSLKGHFLVASPHLMDPNFEHTVVLLLQHGEQGAFGVVLNRPTDSTIEQLWSEVGEGPCHDQRPVRLGGPVSGPLMALHTDNSLSEMEVLPGLHFAAQRENLEELVGRHEQSYRLFVGHSGWGEGQLERELDEGSWLTVPATLDGVFYDEDGDLWKQVAHRIGESILTSALKIKDVPPDLSAN